MAKSGRPKAKVSITFSEEELQSLIIAVNTSIYDAVDHFHQFEVAGVEMFGKEILLLARLRGVQEKKYGAKDAN